MSAIKSWKVLALYVRWGVEINNINPHRLQHKTVLQIIRYLATPSVRSHVYYLGFELIRYVRGPQIQGLNIEMCLSFTEQSDCGQWAKAGRCLRSVRSCRDPRFFRPVAFAVTTVRMVDTGSRATSVSPPAKTEGQQDTQLMYSDK